MGKSYLFLGDSITDCNRFWSSSHPNLGDGYVFMLSESLSKLYPDIHVCNQGQNGLTVYALLHRLRNGSIALPTCDELVLLIGINDVAVSMNTGRSLMDQGFEDTFRNLIVLLRFHCPHILILSPFLFPVPAEHLTWYPELLSARHTMESIASENQLNYLDLHTFFEHELQHNTASALTTDGVHLTAYGHERLASFVYSHLI